MNKAELIDDIASRLPKATKKDVDAFLNAFADSVSLALVNREKVTLVGFGTFEVRERQERQSRNPQTGEMMTVAAKVVPAFSPGKVLKEKVAQ